MEEYREEYRRVGLMGGTFDPIHHAHLIMAEDVRSQLDLNEIVFIPTGHSPHKPGRVITSAEDRLAMVELAIAPNPHFTCSRVEIDREGPSYSVDTLRILHEQWGQRTQLYFVIGWDSLMEMHTWHDPLGILAQVERLVVVKRPGYVAPPGYNDVLESHLPGILQRLLIVQTPLLEISSTDIRRRVAENQSILYRTPEAVVRYIYEHELYRQSAVEQKTE